VEDREIAHRRGAALRRLADELGVPQEAASEALVERWREGPKVTAEPGPEPVPVEEPRRRRRWPLAVLGTLALAGAVVAAVLIGGEDGDEAERPREARPPAAEQRAPRAGPAVKLNPLPGVAGARGTGRIAADRLELRLTGLPPGRYEAWLYDSVAEARRLARFEGPDARVGAKLPDGFERFRFLDVSREPDDGNPNHSGSSVLRAPLKRLLPD
jgi:hypothetical protein